MEPLRFTPEVLRRPTPGPLAVVTELAHFAIVTYAVEPEALRAHVPERFELDLVTLDDGRRRALVSVVPFLDRGFRFARCPWPRFDFGQTNYRAYVTDRETGEHVVWFFGTLLDSLSVLVPRHAWKLPWHRGSIRFETRLAPDGARYERYRMRSGAGWAPAVLELEDRGEPPAALEGFDDLETGLVLLTHPLRGVFRRRDGRLGSYSVWHARLRPTRARVVEARFARLDRLGLVPEGDLASLHSVLLQPSTEFTIYLPPKRL